MILLLITAEGRVRSPANPREICGGQSASGTGFSPRTAVFLVSVIPPISTLLSPTCRSYQRDKRSKAGNLPKGSTFSDIGAHWI